MTIVNDVRSYTDSALEQGKSTLTSASERLSSVRVDTKDAASSAFSLARKQANVSIGVSDAVLAVITKRSQVLPGEARDQAVKLVDTTKDRINQVNDFAVKAQDKVVTVATDLKYRGNDVVEAARNFSLASAASDARGDLDARVARMREDIEGRFTQVKDAINKLADRGEQVATDLRHDPVLVRIIRDADKGVEKAANEVTSVAQKLRSKAAAQAEQEAASTTSTPVRLTPAIRVPTHKTTVRKTPAGEAPISPVPTHRAAAEEAAIRKAAAVKAAATRKADAEEKSAQRAEAAQKAAAKRKEAADAREQAAATRRAAALKAAETRKQNAEAAALAAQARSAAAAKAAETRKQNAEAAALAAQARSAAAANATETRKGNAKADASEATD